MDFFSYIYIDKNDLIYIIFRFYDVMHDSLFISIIKSLYLRNKRIL